MLECGVANVFAESFLVVRAAETDNNQLIRPGEVPACWSTWSSLASANGIVPQLLPPEKRKVAGSIPALARR